MEKIDLFTNEFIEEADLMHYGVKGMKWGVRRNNDGRSGTFKRMREEKQFRKAVSGSSATRYTGESGEPVVAFSKPKRGVVATTGGSNVKVSEDAEIAQVYRHIAANNSISSLSNKQIEAVTKRFQLESNYQQALEKRYPPKQNPLKKIASDFIASEIKGLKGGKPAPAANFLVNVAKGTKAKRAAAAASALSDIATYTSEPVLKTVGKTAAEIVKSTVVK